MARATIRLDADAGDDADRLYLSDHHDRTSPKEWVERGSTNIVQKAMKQTSSRSKTGAAEIVVRSRCTSSPSDSNTSSAKNR